MFTTITDRRVDFIEQEINRLFPLKSFPGCKPGWLFVEEIEAFPVKKYGYEFTEFFIICTTDYCPRIVKTFRCNSENIDLTFDGSLSSHEIGGKTIFSASD